MLYKSIKSPIYANTAIKVILFMKVKKLIIELIGTIIGSFIMAIAVSLFLLPNQLSSGGIAGIATITYYLLNLPMGMVIIAINVPLFILAIFKIGKSFFLKSMVGTITLSIFIDFLEKLQPLTNDRFLACVYGGIIIGLRNSSSFESEFFYRWN